MRGWTVASLAKELRLRARELLATADLSVQEIAAEVGFRDPQCFGRVFRRHFGRTPRDLLGIASALVAAAVGTGCDRPLLPFSLDIPPAVLAPAGLAGVADGRGRFREIYCAIQRDHGPALPEDLPCEEALVRLANEPPGTGQPVSVGRAGGRLRVVVVPGIFEECIRGRVQAFSDGLAHLRSVGYQTGYIPVSGRSSSAHNAQQIRDFIAGMDLAPGERVLLLGYSKGASDSLEALTAYPELVPRVAALVAVAGVIGGSPLADRYSALYSRLLRELDVASCPPGDGGGVQSITRSSRLAALARRPLPRAVKYFSVAGIPGPEKVSALMQPSYRQLSQVDPRNDGQVVFHDAIIPGGTLLGFVRADHWAIAMPFSRHPDLAGLNRSLITHNAFPREIFLEAVVRAIEETL